MKKLMFCLISTSLILNTSLSVMAGTIPKVNINGNKMLLQDSPYIENGIAYMPQKAFEETTGISLGDTSSKAVDKNGAKYIPVRYAADIAKGTLEYDETNNVIDIKCDLPSSTEKDWFGRLKRTTNLPSNSAMYEYIAAGVPNEVYEKPLTFERSIWKITPVEGKDFRRPVMMKDDWWYTKENVSLWQKTLEKSLDLRLNFDYRTVDSNWIGKMMEHYPSKYDLAEGDLDGYYFAGYTKEFSDYIEYAKKNRLIIEGDYYVEPSTVCYKNGAYYLRAWVKYRLNSDTAKTASLYLKSKEEIATNKWHTGYFDISLGTNQPDSIGDDLTIDWETPLQLWQ